MLCATNDLSNAPFYLDGSLPGDVGFDPFCLAGSYLTLDPSATERQRQMLSASPDELQATMAWMRESELKHARLAMIAAAGWPVSELVAGPYGGLASTSGRAPALLNGHLFDLPHG